jgi:hypothetical protein
VGSCLYWVVSGGQRYAGFGTKLYAKNRGHWTAVFSCFRFLLVLERPISGLSRLGRAQELGCVVPARHGAEHTVRLLADHRGVAWAAVG